MKIEMGMDLYDCHQGDLQSNKIFFAIPGGFFVGVAMRSRKSCSEKSGSRFGKTAPVAMFASLVTATLTHERLRTLLTRSRFLRVTSEN